ncbi:MAG: GIY-YIG nuclease family protein [Chloroflexi bacterium]|nr:GIY-YIG nuclease family protein [Chloroflexota bacterium]
MTENREWYFYMVRCIDNSLYSGIATDVDDRVREHNRGTGARYTSGRRPVVLVYSEKHDNVSEARKRESQIKDWAKAKKERLIMGFPRLRSE